jgi:DNA-binding CsgD family transcriptional regulator
MTTRICSVDGCGRRHSAHGYCSTHCNRWRQTGSPQSDRPIAVRGTPSTYGAVHLRLQAVRGSASAYLCSHCAASAQEWAYDGLDPNARIDPKGRGAFTPDLSHYFPLCCSCHRIYDRAQRPPAPPPCDVETAAALYRDMSAQEVAARLGVTGATVITHLRRAGVAIRTRGTPPGGRQSRFDVDRCVALYRSGLSAAAIALKVGAGRTTVKRLLKQAGVEMRPSSLPRQRKGSR